MLNFGYINLISFTSKVCFKFLSFIYLIDDIDQH